MVQSAATRQANARARQKRRMAEIRQIMEQHKTGWDRFFSGIDERPYLYIHEVNRILELLDRK